MKDDRMKTVMAIFPVLALVMLSGCVPLAIGGAAAGGYYIGKDERDPGVIATDSRITTAVKTRFLQDKYVDGLKISVETYEGIVTLRGEVGSNLPREQAERLAAAVDGVVSVRNEIRVVRKPEN
ncbi:MAG: BON domain-containing protein [Gammaproteobacteria bacterium]